MLSYEFTLFDTAIGRCGIAWNARGIVGVQLPERRDDATRVRLTRKFPDATEATPPDHVRQVIDGIIAVLRGEKRDLSGAALDMEGVPGFHQQIYAVARSIPAGATLSYGVIATRLGDRSAARERRWARIRSRSSCPAIACWLRAASWGASRRMAGSPRNCACSKSSARRLARRRRCSAACL
jgi:methylated-DNA-[protein]-cysteine S-methyltransferase